MSWNLGVPKVRKLTGKLDPRKSSDSVVWLPRFLSLNRGAYPAKETTNLGHEAGLAMVIPVRVEGPPSFKVVGPSHGWNSGLWNLRESCLHF